MIKTTSVSIEPKNAPKRKSVVNSNIHLWRTSHADECGGEFSHQEGGNSIRPGSQLPRFRRIRHLPKTDTEKITAVHSPLIKRVANFCLGPLGTNIEMAARGWTLRMGLAWKSNFFLTTTPEEALVRAKEISDVATLGIFWTCAVFVRENEIFFKNPDTLPFFFTEEMALDGMNLAINPSSAGAYFEAGGLTPNSTIATHPSPKPLMEGLSCKAILANSNAAAAKLCAEGKTTACITTRRAAEGEGLVIVHDFGSPLMKFYGGIALPGAKLLARAHGTQGASSEE